MDLATTQTDKKRVVAIDDEPEILRLYNTFLTHCGYEVHLADNAAKGIELIREKEPDVVLLDINMPGINGIRTLELVRSDPKTRDATVLMVSARRDETTVKEALKLGCDNFLVKPFKLKELAERLNHETVSIDERDLRSIIKPPLTLPKSATLQKEPGLMDYPVHLWDAFASKIGENSVAILTAKGVRPEIFYRSLSVELERSLIAFIKNGRRWRKVWPKSKKGR